MVTLLELKNDKWTLHELNYSSSFWKDWLTQEIESQSREQVIDFFIQQNLNTPMSFVYITDYWLSQAQEEEPKAYFIEQLTTTKNVLTLNILGLKPSIPSLKHLLVTWLDKEIKIIRYRERNTTNQSQTELFSQSNTKIELSISVAQIAYLFRLLSKSGIIINKSQTDIFQVLSEKFRSKKSESISFDSLHNRYYNVEDRTKESVKEILRKLLSQI